MDELYDSLLIQDPNGNDIPWLAESYFIENHDDNPDVPTGHTRITFDLIKNATWSDGMQLSARDVAFTFNYYHEHVLSHAADLEDMYAAYAPTDYRFVIEFVGESYWYLHKVGYKDILPKHIWMDIDAPTSYFPQYNELVTSGPFFISDYESGVFIELTKNPYYFYSPSIEASSSTPQEFPSSPPSESQWSCIRTRNISFLHLLRPRKDL